MRVCARCERREGNLHEPVCPYFWRGGRGEINVVKGFQTVVAPPLPEGQPVEYDGGMVQVHQPDASRASVQFGYDDSGMTEEQRARAEDLAHWWMAKAAAEVEVMIPKAIRYGSSDLKVMGAAMLEIYPQLRDVVDGQELAIWFYVQGKVARLIGGYVQGELPDEDSWWDLKVYAAMAQHVREFGGW